MPDLADWQTRAPRHEAHDGRFYEACSACDMAGPKEDDDAN